jgi:hypothetical protein
MGMTRVFLPVPTSTADASRSTHGAMVSRLPLRHIPSKLSDL